MARTKKIKDFSDPITKRNWIIQALRRASYRWPGRYEVMKNARMERGKYKCASCEKIYGRKEISLDHIDPVVDPHKGFETFDTYIQRLFCPAEKWQVLCDTCHGAKSKRENEIRRLAKAAAKKKESKKKK